MIAVVVGNQRTDTDNRVVDVLRKLVAQRGTDIIVAAYHQDYWQLQSPVGRVPSRYPKRERVAWRVSYHRAAI